MPWNRLGWLEGVDPYAAQFDGVLVLASILVAAGAAVLSMRAFAEARRTRTGQKQWLWAAAITLALGVWAMHFTAMLAMTVPVPMSYDVGGTALSVLPPIVCALIALTLLFPKEREPWRLPVAGVVLAVGIGGMHYGGMAAIRTSAIIRYDPAMMVLSVLVAIGIATLALWRFISFEEGGHPLARTISAACVGLVIPVIHFTAMGATRLYPGDGPGASADDISPVLLAILINMMVAVLIVMLVASAMVRSLRRSAKREARYLRTLLDLAPIGILQCDADGTVRMANREAMNMFGHSPDQLSGRRIEEFIVQRDDRPHATGIHRIGTTFMADVMSSSLDDDELSGTLYIIRDITAQQIQEQRLEQWAAAMVQATQAILISDTSGAITYVNPAYLKLSGVPEDEILGERSSTFDEATEGSGDVWSALRSGQGWFGRMNYPRRGGPEYSAETRISPIRDSEGEITGYVEVRQDRSEEERLEGELVQAQKLEAVGQLAAGIAHEINTPVQFIGDNLRFIETGLADLERLIAASKALTESARASGFSPDLVAKVEEVSSEIDPEDLLEEMPAATRQSLDGVKRVATIVGAMKDYAHPSNEPIMTDLNQAISSTITVARNEWKYVADMDLQLDPELPNVMCLPGEINQVVLNMLINAAHAIEDVVGDGGTGKGKITVRTRSVGETVEIEIEDTGAGIPDDVRERIFDPFFTTKEVGKGTGQGLSIAHQIVVVSHGGTLAVDSKPGEGTRFTIGLPLMRDSKEAVA